MPIIDFHCDTIYELYHSSTDQNLYKNDLHIDIQKLQQADVMTQVFALFMDAKEIQKQNKTPMECAYAMNERFEYEINQYSSHIARAHNFEDIMNHRAQSKISAIVSVEGGEVLEGKIENLKQIYKWGTRILTLTWNYANELGFPHSQIGGLTAFGKDVVQYMNELCMLIDVSHLSDDGFWDVISITQSPIIASHSNARAVRGHSRNLTDPMIRAIAETGGVIGLNLYGLFLANDGSSTIDHIMAHIDHIYQVGGIESIALGGDFDGFIGELEVYNASKWGKLIDRLKNKNMTDDYIDKITYKNALRVLKDVL